MGKIYKTKSIADALELAQEFKKKGKYNLFRGQAQNWEVIPTAGRVSKNKIQESEEQLKRLLYYFNSELSLKKYCSRIDDFFAIAQHYGLPTNYIDFTKSIDVAFYFATNSKSNKLNDNCSIICLNENDFKSFVTFSKCLYERDQVIPPYIVTDNVENLWRLQAQKGCFLFTPYDKIEMFYDFDKILFPFDSPFNKILKEDIYPERKSELEIMLDSYFDTERRIKGQKRMFSFAKELNIPITHIPEPNQFEILEKREIHKSWYSYTYRKWNFKLNEQWQDSSTQKTIHIFILKPQLEQLKKLPQIIGANLNEEYLNNKIDRRTPLVFNIKVDIKLSMKNLSLMNENCRRIWDGTRNLPFKNEEIFKIISKYLCLEIESLRKEVKTNLITLEMTNKYGSKTRFKASPENVVKAFRDDIEEVIDKNKPRPIPSELLLFINKPRYIFDFKKLIEFFKEEAIIQQIFHNRGNKNPVIFYTPSQIKVLGYA
ncbi:MAG: FRG domain-containing protein [Marinifilum sp.]|jgi:hypothetical protein|nr:FRG domain-containing protein [Marinifilum sp.]